MGDMQKATKTTPGVFPIKIHLYPVHVPFIMYLGSGVPAWSKSHYSLARQCLSDVNIGAVAK